MTRREPTHPSVSPPDPPVRGAQRALVVLAGPLDRAALVALTDDVERLLMDRDVHVVICDVESHPAADLRVVETLARLALTAKRVGRRIRVRHASPQVRSFLAYAGLAEVLPCDGLRDGSVEAGR